MCTNSSFDKNEAVRIVKNMMLRTSQIYSTLHLLTCCIFKSIQCLQFFLGDDAKMFPKEIVKNEGMGLFS